MAEDSWAEALLSASRGGDRAALLQPASERTSPRHIRLRRVRAALVQLGDEVRKRHRLAELLEGAAGRDRNPHRPKPGDRAHRGLVRALWRAPRPCLRRRAEAHRPALVHEWARAELPRRLIKATMRSLPRLPGAA